MKIRSLLLGLLVISSPALASDAVGRSKAEGHLTRAKALMIAALREFDQGVKALPQKSSLNTNSWRGTVAEKAQELDRLISPRSRPAQGGAKYEAYPELLSESKR